MKNIVKYGTIDEFCTTIQELLDLGHDVAVIGRYQFILDTMNCLVKDSDLELYSVQIEHPAVGNYQDSWVMNIDGEGKIWCEKAVKDGRFLDTWGMITLVDCEAGEKVIDYYDDASVISIDEVEDLKIAEDENNLYISQTMPDGLRVSVSLYSDNNEIIKMIKDLFTGKH